jgi:hypothetical protein
MKKEPNYPLYRVNEKKKAVSCKIKTRGQFFVGVAKCHDDDVFDIEKGKDIAYNRCRLEINKFILEQDRKVEDVIKDIIKQCDEYDLGKVRSKAWDCYLDDIRGRIEQRRLFIRKVEDKLEVLLK